MFSCTCPMTIYIDRANKDVFSEEIVKAFDYCPSSSLEMKLLFQILSKHAIWQSWLEYNHEFLFSMCTGIVITNESLHFHLVE